MCFSAMLCFKKKVDDLGLLLWTGIWNQFSSWLTILSVITILNSFITWMAIKIFTVVGKLRNKKSFSVKDFSQQAHFFFQATIYIIECWIEWWKNQQRNRKISQKLLGLINIYKNWFLKSLPKSWPFGFLSDACQAP